jgi:hypothetical protein
MTKKCAKCKIEFECKADDIMNCHCNVIQLSPEQVKQIADQYPFENCLCNKCLKEFVES